MASGGRRKRGLSEDDWNLWRRVTESAVPLLPLHLEMPALPNFPVARDVAPLSIKPFHIGEKSNRKKGDIKGTPNIASKTTANSPNMDGRNFDRLKKGKMAVDGRIDLHGMTLAEANPALTGFVQSAHMAGKRLLLVITGKGRSFDGEGLMTARRGILNHQVPLWLQNHPLAPLVLQVTQAHGKHGGSGAYYVYLRRRR